MLEATYPYLKKIYFIGDNARYHYSLLVQEYLKNSCIIFVLLPAYSPELNLIERIWLIFKKEVIYNKYYHTYAKFVQAYKDFFTNQYQYKEQIISAMGDGLAGLVY